MSYDASALSPNDATDQEWSLAWVRRIAGDDTENERNSDAEWLAELSADTVTGEDDTVYYRPHVTAARLVASQNAAVRTESLLGGSITYRSPQARAQALRSAYAWMDDLIPEDDRPGPLSLRPRF